MDAQRELYRHSGIRAVADWIESTGAGGALDIRDAELIAKRIRGRLISGQFDV